MIILAIDSGLEKTGFSIFSNIKDKYKYLHSGLIKTSKDKTIAQRILQIYNELSDLIKKYHPDEIVMEQIFFFKNHKTVIGVSQAQGSVLLLAAQNKLPISTLTPLEIKLAVTGYGSTDKKGIQKMIKYYLKEKVTIIDDDQSDAIACGLAFCFINANKKLYK